MSFAGAVRWTLSGKSFTSMVSVGAPGMANSTTSLWFSSSAYATVLGATQIVSSSIDLAGQAQPHSAGSPMLHFGIGRPDERGLITNPLGLAAVRLTGLYRQ